MFAFPPQVELLSLFISRRGDIVMRIDQMLNCQKKPLEYQQDQALLARQFKDCFFTGLGPTQIGLRDQLEHAHWASGFKPRANPGNDIIDPAALMVRGFHLWNQTRWPGQRGRLRYAQMLFNVYLVRCLTLLLMRLWDAEPDAAGERLAQAQHLLDEVWRGSPSDLPVLVRDVRWLIPVAMSPTTDQLKGYFDVAAKVATTLSATDQLEIQLAHVVTGAGHLRSQLRHLAVRKQVPVNDHRLVLITRVSNALDVSLLMEGLAMLLAAYERALQQGDDAQRLALASAICQGLSPDPELYVNRLDLLGPYTMIEHLFIATDDDGYAAYTANGQRHLQLLRDYKALIGRLAKPLLDDCRQCAPMAGRYSPYGVLFGFSSNLLELAAFKSLQLDAETRFCMEDAFTDGDADKLAWVNGWRNLPHIKPDVVKQFGYPQQFAAEMHARVEQALQSCVAEGEASATRDGKLHLVMDEAAQPAAAPAAVDELPIRYIVSSDAQRVAAHKATLKDENDLLYCRIEGEFVVSYQTANGWVAITKDFLTEVLGEGHDVKITGLPQTAAAVVRLMCPDLAVTQS